MKLYKKHCWCEKLHHASRMHVHVSYENFPCTSDSLSCSIAIVKHDPHCYKREKVIPILKNTAEIKVAE